MINQSRNVTNLIESMLSLAETNEVLIAHRWYGWRGCGARKRRAVRLSAGVVCG